MSVTIPLFPLGSVLFPGLVLPLHVFEPRYRVLVQDLLQRPQGERRFGVVAIRQGREVGERAATALYDVGCTAEVRRIEPFEDGRFALVSTGGRRFRLGPTDGSRPYLQAEVEPLPDGVGDAPAAAALVPVVRHAFGEYVEALGRSRGAQVQLPEDLPTDPAVLGYLVAATVVVELDERQALLEQPDAAARLRALAVLLRRENRLLARLGALPAPELRQADVNLN